MSAPKLLIFDSGVGGLSIAGCINRRLPQLDLAYLADNAGFPYGEQPEDVIIDRCCSLVGELLRQDHYDMVVVACNTASTVVLPALRARTHLPVIGVVPAVKPAAALSANRRIGVLATPATVSRPYLNDLIAEFASDCVVERVGHPDLVHWIEGQVIGAELPERALSEALEPFRVADVDTVVLGCTHYPLIKPLLQALIPRVEHWVDSGDAIARRVVSLLAEDSSAVNEAGRECPLSEIYFTGEKPVGIERYLDALKLGADRVISDWSVPVKSNG